MSAAIIDIRTRKPPIRLAHVLAAFEPWRPHQHERVVVMLPGIEGEPESEWAATVLSGESLGLYQVQIEGWGKRGEIGVRLCEMRPAAESA